MVLVTDAAVHVYSRSSAFLVNYLILVAWDLNHSLVVAFIFPLRAMP
jgi:hypothetical protein